MEKVAKPLKFYWDKFASNISLKEYAPKSFTCLREGYTFQKLCQDLFAGLTIGIISLPLAMAFAIASGLSPEKGLFTSIIAGFLISLLGGSRVQIGGPTGAFVVLVLDVVNRHGYEGLAIATILAGFLLIIMGVLRFGTFLKFIPYPVITGLTAGIAVVLFTSQIKDFLGLNILHVPTEFLGKWHAFLTNIGTANLWACFLGFLTIGIILLLRKYCPKIPGAIIAVIIAGFLVSFLDLPVETIQTKFGQIPSMLPMPSFPWISLESIRVLLPDAIAIAILAGLESLLSAVVADGMTGHRHRSNCELVGQGVANIFAIIFGGMPATGAIARTATNIRMGGRTPVAGMVHALVLFLIILFFSRIAAMIPLAALAGLLIVIAWNMAEIENFAEIFKGPKTDSVLLLVTFVIAILIDITAGVEIGILLAALFFMKRMADTTHLTKKALTESLIEESERKDRDAIYKKEIPEGVEVIQINGPLFFGASDLLNEALKFKDEEYSIIILRMSHVPVIDMTGIRALKHFAEKCKKEGIILCLSGVNQKILMSLQSARLDRMIGKEMLFSHLDDALLFARKKLEAENSVSVVRSL